MTPSRLFDFITYQKDNAPLEKSFTTKYDGKWESISSEMFCEQAESISNALIELGIEPQDKIAMISSNNRLGIILFYLLQNRKYFEVNKKVLLNRRFQPRKGIFKGEYPRGYFIVFILRVMCPIPWES